MTVEIRIQDDDSLEITGDFDLVDADGTAYNQHGKIRLCRCGASNTKPFCDDTHDEINWVSKVRV
jgi:CDGSH-type Zn-finger protein